MFVVAEGDTVRMTIENHSGEIHPMHLHGHHAVVLSRNGIPATGSPW
jgi:FtsP/CotA-like multicopper oxidase with cupredoxin domain